MKNTILILPLLLAAVVPQSPAQSKQDCPIPKGFEQRDRVTLSPGQSYTSAGGRVLNGASGSGNVNVYYYVNPATHEDFLCVDVAKGTDQVDISIANGTCRDRVNVNGNSKNIKVTGDNITLDIDGSSNTLTYIGNNAHIDGGGLQSKNTITLGASSNDQASNTQGVYGGSGNTIEVRGDNNKGNTEGNNNIHSTGNNNSFGPEVEVDISC